jgi:hypothetical protein
MHGTGWSPPCIARIARSARAAAVRERQRDSAQQGRQTMRRIGGARDSQSETRRVIGACSTSIIDGATPVERAHRAVSARATIRAIAALAVDARPDYGVDVVIAARRERRPPDARRRSGDGGHPRRFCVMEKG